MRRVIVYAAPLIAAALVLRQFDGSLPQVIPFTFALVVVPLAALHLLLKDVNS